MGSFAEIHTGSWGGPHHFGAAHSLNKSSEAFRPMQSTLPFEFERCEAERIKSKTA